MKVAHLIAEFLANNGIERVYTVSGGGDLHIIDAICSRSDMRIICPQNEQGASFAADAEARLTGIGCALATSGPGATNFITGIAASYYDSVPVLFITGNQTRQRLGIGLGVRQFGFQSMPFVDLVQSITKYATVVMNELDVLSSLEAAVWFAKNGRPGPVVVDFPDDIQRADVDIATLRHFDPPIVSPLAWKITEVQELLLAAKKPVIALGWGVHLAGARYVARDMIDRLQVPCVTTWGAHDIMAGHPLHVGSWGTHGVRAANFAVQNADLVIAIGTRLDTKATGSPASSFAPKATLVMVDIDVNELGKMMKIGRACMGIRADALDFIEALQSAGSYADWLAKVLKWKEDYPAVLPEYGKKSPYRIMQRLMSLLHPDDLVVSDTGCPLAWAMQVGLKCRFLHAMNQTPMGYGLPASIGAAATHKGRVILITGDGGLSVNITEMATIAKHKLDVRVVLFNNRGHQMCRQTQRQWLGGVYHGTSPKDLATPDFTAVAGAYGFAVCESVEGLLCTKGPSFLEVKVGFEEGVSPQVRFGKSIEDADPALPDGVLAEIMR